MHPILLDMLVCPVCKSKLRLDGSRLVCQFEKVYYPIHDDIPVLLPEARLPLDENISANDHE